MKHKYLYLIWGLVLIVAGGVLLSQDYGAVWDWSSRVWMISFAALSTLSFASYLIEGVRQWGWLFPAGIGAALALIAGLGEAGITGTAVGVPVPASIAVPFVVAFALDRRRKWWALIPAWVMTVLTAIILMTDYVSSDAVAVFVLLAIALPFLVVYLVDRRRWWGLIPFGVFCFTALVVLLSTQAAGRWLGAAVMFVIALPFLVTYLWSSRNWWALIPAGALATIGVTVLVFGGDRFEASSARWINSLLFLGWAGTFAVLWMRRRVQPTVWAKYPAIGLAAVALLSVLPSMQVGQLWPAVPIVLGIVLLWVGLRPKRSGQD
ncbi:MAG: hypothetical protein ACK2VD_25440 [Anaerolineae bacterium]